MHGVAPNVERRFRYQNIADRQAARRFLSSIPRLVPLSAALAGAGDALTIDDATRGGADASMLARDLGHEVSLFVNPEVVESGDPYWFNLMDVLVDALSFGSYHFDSDSVAVTNETERRGLRERIKTNARALRDERDRVAYVRSLATHWQVSIDVPRHYEILRKADLVELRDAGVDLQNHGWSHADHSRLSSQDSASEIRRGREWLKTELAVDAAYFAVTYGDVMPHEQPAECDSWLTFFWQQPGGPMAAKVFNRVDLPPDEHTGATESTGWLSSVVRRLRGA
jgi:hypothetical protein